MSVSNTRTGVALLEHRYDAPFKFTVCLMVVRQSYSTWLRSGFAAAAIQAGASTYKIRQTTGHRSSLSRYFRDVDLFADNAAARVR